jgi:hypothetical protein
VGCWRGVALLGLVIRLVLLVVLLVVLCVVLCVVLFVVVLALTRGVTRGAVTRRALPCSDKTVDALERAVQAINLRTTPPCPIACPASTRIVTCMMHPDALADQRRWLQ